MNKIKELYCGAICCIAIAGLTACSSQDDLSYDKDDQTANQPSSCKLRLNVSRSQYADEALTRSASEWENGDKIYLTFTAENVKSHGEAVYNDGIWTVDYYGSLAQGEANTCTAVYFDKPLFDNGSVVTINENTGIYEDLEGTYTMEGDELTVTANLRPKTGRIRFAGQTDEVLTVNGITHYTSYDASTGKYSTTSGSVKTYVATDSTPYIYGYMSEDNRRLNLVTTESAYTRMIPEGIFNAGESGYMDIPSPSSHKGWQNYVIFKAEGVEFKMIPVNYHEGNFLLAETELTQELYYYVTQKKLEANSHPQRPGYAFGSDSCLSFLDLINSQLNLTLRIPTLAEWKHAFTGGEKSQGYNYSGSNNIDEVALYNLNNNDPWHNPGNVKLFKPNELGFYDMSGNAWEIVVKEDGDFGFFGGDSGSNADRCSTEFPEKPYNNFSSKSGGLRMALSVNRKAGEIME